MSLEWLKLCGQRLTGFVFPSCCLHCESLDLPQGQLLCGLCSDHLPWIDPTGRCSVCFNPTTSKDVCLQCERTPPPFDCSAAAMEYIGPAVSLTTRLKYGGLRYLSEGIAALMLVQWERLGWEVPDLIVPSPMSWARRWIRGYNQSELIAAEFAKLLQVPVARCMRKDPEVLPQASLSRKERAQLTAEHFSLRGGGVLEGQRVLLIDDVWTTGATAWACCEKMLEARPAGLQVMTWARTEMHSGA